MSDTGGADPQPTPAADMAVEAPPVDAGAAAEGGEEKEDRSSRRRRRDEERDERNGHRRRREEGERGDNQDRERRRRRDDEEAGEDRERRERRGDRDRERRDRDDDRSRRRRRDEEDEKHKDREDKDEDKRRRRDEDRAGSRDRHRERRDHDRRRDDKDRDRDRDRRRDDDRDRARRSDRDRPSTSDRPRRSHASPSKPPQKVFTKAAPIDSYFVRLELHGRNRTSQTQVREFLDKWKDRIRQIELNQRREPQEDGACQYHVVEFEEMDDAKAVVTHFANDRDAQVNDMPARLTLWANGVRRERTPEQPTLEKEFGEATLTVYNFNAKRAYQIKTSDVIHTPVVAELCRQGLLNGGGTINLCMSQQKCWRGADTCMYVHLKNPRMDMGEEVPFVKGLKGAIKGMTLKGSKGLKGGVAVQDAAPAEPPFNPSAVEMIWEDDDDADEDAFRPHYETCLLVRDVDDTGSDGSDRSQRPRLTEPVFKQMWQEIDGYVNAKLYRTEDTKHRYGSAYGIVQFETVEAATDAMAQTFGHRLNVSFFGVEEMLEEAGTQLQMAQRTSAE